MGYLFLESPEIPQPSLCRFHSSSHPEHPFKHDLDAYRPILPRTALIEKKIPRVPRATSAVYS
jgi:hypothetical protein